MLKRIFIASLCLALAGCTTKEEMLSEQARMYDSFQTSNNPGTTLRLAESMKSAGNIDNAIKLYEQTLQLDPTSLPAHLGLSQCLRYSGRAEAALEALKAVPAGDQPKEYYKELANVYMAKQDPREAANHFMKAYQLDNKDLGAINGIAVSNDLLTHHDEAQKWYRQAIELAPAHDRLKSNYGLSLALSGQTKEAINVLKTVVYGPDVTSRDRQNLAIAYGLDSQIDQAAKLFAQDLDEEDVRTNLAFVYKLAKSQKYVQKSVDVKSQAPTNGEITPLAHNLSTTIESTPLPESSNHTSAQKKGNEEESAQGKASTNAQAPSIQDQPKGTLTESVLGISSQEENKVVGNFSSSSEKTDEKATSKDS